jgi:hypothetical protein
MTETITVNKELLRDLAGAILSLKIQVIQLEEIVRKLRIEGLK